MKRAVFLFLIICFVFPLFGFASIQEDKVIDLPIVMYHNVLKSRTGKYIVSPAQLEADFVALNEAGYTTVFMSEVIDWVNGIGTLPAKPIVITFDDGFYNNIYYGLDLAAKYDVKFMINPVTGYSKLTSDRGDGSNPNYSYITLEQLGAVTQSGRVEIGSHTHSMHSYKPRYGVMRISGESLLNYLDNLRQDLTESQNLIEQSGCPRPTTFAYPFGKYSKESRELLLQLGFKALLTSNQHNNKIIRGDTSCLHNLGRFNRDGDWTSQKLLKKIAPK